MGVDAGNRKYKKRVLRIKVNFAREALGSYIVGAIVIAVSISNDGQAGEEVPGSKDRPIFAPVSCVPECKPIAEEVFCCTGHTELHMDLPITHGYRLGGKKGAQEFFFFKIY